MPCEPTQGAIPLWLNSIHKTDGHIFGYSRKKKTLSFVDYSGSPPKFSIKRFFLAEKLKKGAETDVQEAMAFELATTTRVDTQTFKFFMRVILLIVSTGKY